MKNQYDSVKQFFALRKLFIIISQFTPSNLQVLEHQSDHHHQRTGQLQERARVGGAPVATLVEASEVTALEPLVLVLGTGSTDTLLITAGFRVAVRLDTATSVGSGGETKVGASVSESIGGGLVDVVRGSRRHHVKLGDVAHVVGRGPARQDHALGLSTLDLRGSLSRPQALMPVGPVVSIASVSDARLLASGHSDTWRDISAGAKGGGLLALVLGHFGRGSAEAASELLGDSDPSLVRSLLADKVLIEKGVVVPQHISDGAVAASGARWASDQRASKVVALGNVAGGRVRVVDRAVNGLLGGTDLAVRNLAVASARD